MFFPILRAEAMKCRRNPVWIAFLILPLFPAFLGTFNYLGNLSVLRQQWYSLWSQHTLFSAFFFMPAQFGVFCAWQWRMEYSGSNWNCLLTAPMPRSALYFAKLTLAAGTSVLAQLCIGVLFLAAGALAGIAAPLPPELAEWLCCGALGGVAVCAVQLFLSLVFRSFALPVLLGLLGGIVGLVLTAKGFGLYFPYSLLSFGMRANNPSLSLPFPMFFAACLFYIVLFSAASVLLLSRRDAAAA